MILPSADISWQIEARAFPIPGTLLFHHNFWLLTAPDGAVSGQLHGLAIDPVTGESRAVGSPSDLLQAVSDPSIAWSLIQDQPRRVCASGDRADVLPRWEAAQAAIPALNALRIPYPALWQQLYRQNSNTVFSTLGLIMGFAEPARLLPGIAPGCHLIISQAIIERFRFQ